MRLSLFDSFADMIENIPARAIIRVLEREQRMLAEDLFCQRPVPVKDATSILGFCAFIDAALEEMPAELSTPLPQEHLEFYRKTVERLIAAEELPFDAQMEFDRVTAGDCLAPLHYAN